MLPPEMQDPVAIDSGSALVSQLRSAPDTTHLVAVVWTWLQQHLRELGSLRIVPASIVGEARQRPFEGMVDDEFERLVANPLVAAAELLVRITDSLRASSGEGAWARYATGFDGRRVVVVWKVPALAQAVGGGAGPPAGMEHPSLRALVDRLVVLPEEEAELRLEVHEPHGPEWDAVRLKLESGLARRTLAIHLDPLQHHGLTGWTTSESGSFGWYDECGIDQADEADCQRAAEAAVAAASGGHAILVMPELALTPHVLEHLRATLRGAGRPPALTVVGLYHCAREANLHLDLAAQNELAAHVNQAVVLGPDGGELWRHTKLSKAHGTSPSSHEPAPVEDIVLGGTLKLVPTPAGLMSVAICLDSFEERARERLAKSGSDVVIVPSLSPRVKRHRASLQHLVQTLWGAAFVCNRAVLSPGETSAEQLEALWNEDVARSFWAIQRQPVTVPPAWKSGHPSFVFHL